MNPKYLLLLMFCVIGTGTISAQVLSGTVADSKTEITLAGANIVVNDTIGVTSDGDGKFSITLKPGEYKVAVSFIGYETNEMTIVLNGSGNNEALMIYLVPTEEYLGEVVVSAGKFEQRLEETTVSLDVLKPSLVQDKNQVTLKTTLQQAPGVNVTDGQANIRSGSGWTYGAGTRVQTLVDGLPLISADANQVQWDLVPIYGMERIEVLKGASSVLYGSAALNGVVNVFTLQDANVKQSLNVNLYTGIYDAPKRKSLKWWNGARFNSGVNFNYNQPVNEHNAFTLSGGHIQDQGYRYLDDERRTRLFAKFLHESQKIKGLDASLATHIMYSDVGNSLLWESDSLGYIPLDSSITVAYGWDLYVDPKVSYHHGKLKHVIQGRYLRINNITFDNQIDFSNRSNLFTGEYRLQHFTNFSTLTLGAASTFSESMSVIFAGDHTTTNNAVFFQADLKFWGWLNANAGIRYEAYRIDSRFYERPVYRAGINASITRATFVRASYGEAYRFPSMAETFTTTKVGVLSVYPNPRLNPETGVTSEIGIRQMYKFQEVQGYLDIAIFQLHYNNMIEYNASFWGPFLPPQFGFGFLPLNIGATRIRGVELATALEGEMFGFNYRLLGGYTYTLPQIENPDHSFGKDTAGQEVTYRLTSTDLSNNILKYRYQHLAKLDAQAEWEKLTVGFSIRYNDFMQNIDAIFYNDFLNTLVPGIEANRIRNPNGDFFLDFRIGYYVTPEWKVDFLIDNVLNHEQMIRPAYLGPPRSFTLRVNYNFKKA